ncbi:MAG: phosphoenolpyruvate--protein phosphotransferase [Lachnospiraceae bacterium]|nr:phosphoenolpyruvate--protein phosphotransferase [Lachnospiraceae bacterium]
MTECRGISVFGGVAIGKIKVLIKCEQQVKRIRVKDSSLEIERYQGAKKVAIGQLEMLHAKALREVGESGAAIFEVHQMMLEDDDFNEAVENIILSQNVNAEYAVAGAGDNFANIFSAMDDEYMQGRATDVKDISERVISILLGRSDNSDIANEPVIIVAKDLTPSETVQLDKEKVLAFVTEGGSVNSHTAILARTMGIPALVSTDIRIDESLNGKTAVVDGGNGVFYVEPDENIVARMKKKQEENNRKKELLQELKGKETITRSGRKIKLYANIGNIKDLALVMQNDAEGIGLFRSEFIYLERDSFPTEEEQFAIYKTVAETMAGKEIIIRTLDIGADKQCEYFGISPEENPAMGYRAIRICLDRPDIFKVQLRALHRAAAYGNVAVMFPMIISLEEVLAIKKVVKEVREELENEKIPYANPQIGLMIETPAAVAVSKILAKEVDFFSIGTNDLTQYTLAIDRQNSVIDKYYDAHHPAILAMIDFVVKNAHKEGIWVGICGELGADTELTETFVAMGIDELSVSPGQVLAVRNKIRNIS